MNANKELEEFINLIIDITIEFCERTEIQEDQDCLYYEPEYRRFFDVALVILLGERNLHIPSKSNYREDLYGAPGIVDTFHRTLLKTELGKLNWDIQILHFTPEESLSKLQDEETRNFIEEAIKDTDVDFCYDYFNDYVEYMCIILENKEIVKSSRFWDKELQSKINLYLSFIGYVHDYNLGSLKEVCRERVRYCILVTECYTCNDIDFLAINMYYCTPITIIAAWLLDDLCKVD